MSLFHNSKLVSITTKKIRTCAYYTRQCIALSMHQLNITGSAVIKLSHGALHPHDLGRTCPGVVRTWQAELESLQEDLGEGFRLPRDHRVEDNLIRDNLEQASEDRQISSTNLGFKLLQRMGWKGKGLGKTEQGGRYFYTFLNFLLQ